MFYFNYLLYNHKLPVFFWKINIFYYNYNWFCSLNNSLERQCSGILFSSKLDYMTILPNFNILQNQMGIIFYKIFFIWRGFKLFISKNILFVWLGFSHYIQFKIPVQLRIFCKKRRIYFYSRDTTILQNFLHLLMTIQLPNFYKGKGFFEHAKFKGHVKLKKIKKKQYL